MKLSSLQTDANLATKGVRFEFGSPDENGKQAWFQIGHSENSRTKLTKLMRAAAQKLPIGKTLKEDVVERLSKEAMCHTVLIDFGGIDNDDGTEMEVNDATMMEILNTAACFLFISNRSTELANFQTEKEAVETADTKSGAPVES